MVAWTVLPAHPAAAHSGGGTGPTNFRATLTVLSPAVPGVTLAMVEGGRRMQVGNDTAVPVVVAGYDGEPYLRVGANGTFVNRNSPTAYRNESRYAGRQLPAGAGAATAPEWQWLSDDRSHRWTDHRMHRPAEALPPAVTEAPDRVHRLGTWTVRLTHGASVLTAGGTLDWVPGPAPWGWLAAAALLAAGVAALGLVRRPHRWLAAVTGCLVAADVLHSAGFAAAVGDGVPARLGLVAVQLVMWPFAAAVAVSLLRGRSGAVWLAAVVGASAVVTTGWPDLPVLWHSSSPSVLPPTLDRMATAVVLGAGLGLVGTVLAVLARERRQAAVAASGQMS